MPEAYESLPPRFRAYVDALLEHAQTALWPERRAALESFYRGIARSSEADLEAAAAVLNLDPQSGEGPGERIFRHVLTAYLSRLGDRDVTNPDQAEIYRLSLDPGHADLAERWALTREDPDGDS